MRLSEGFQFFIEGRDSFVVCSDPATLGDGKDAIDKNRSLKWEEIENLTIVFQDLDIRAIAHVIDSDRENDRVGEPEGFVVGDSLQDAVCGFISNPVVEGRCGDRADRKSLRQAVADENGSSLRNVRVHAAVVGDHPVLALGMLGLLVDVESGEEVTFPQNEAQGCMKNDEVEGDERIFHFPAG